MSWEKGIELGLELLKSFGVITASFVAIWGINSWRREARWKRKYELAEEVLASLYEAHQSIKIIRSPLGFGGEGSSRTKNENETKEQTEIFNQAYVARERYERNKRPLDKLHSLKFRFIALYGKEYEAHFNVFSQTVNKIFLASDQIAMVKLGQFGDDRKLISEIMTQSSRDLYAAFKDKDQIEKDLTTAIKAIEDKCRVIIGKKD
ncbi:hypothetical protein GO009_16430 [Muricauda sp. TY007]|uniref:hypothetical protein n=1 Tax=Allomuricauda sp. TY007 TaxID=2683200 RepID=UPI0013C1A1D8|nr:hypothetical protein [Muricauda sp. TY007]NDV17605.1 hypothetical protein [Muricauda sp. TY007]